MLSVLWNNSQKLKCTRVEGDVWWASPWAFCSRKKRLSQVWSRKIFLPAHSLDNLWNQQENNFISWQIRRHIVSKWILISAKNNWEDWGLIPTKWLPAWSSRQGFLLPAVNMPGLLRAVLFSKLLRYMYSFSSHDVKKQMSFSPKDAACVTQNRFWATWLVLLSVFPGKACPEAVQMWKAWRASRSKNWKLGEKGAGVFDQHHWQKLELWCW